jgi:trimethylamine corrinoid protein
LVTAGVEPIATAVILTVEGDQHDIGKNIVKTLLEANFFTVYDLGRDCPAELALEKAKEYGAQIILGSAVMTTTMPAQRKLLEYLVEEGVRDDYIVLFGGAPVTARWCTEIGADGYGDTAADAVPLLKELLAKKKK